MVLRTTMRLACLLLLTMAGCFAARQVCDPFKTWFYQEKPAQPAL